MTADNGSTDPEVNYFNGNGRGKDMEGTVDLIQRMGLTKYEAMAYLSLVTRNIDTARQLSKDSGVPRTKIYSVLEGLAEKGWVKIVSGWPLLFRPVTPEKVMEMKRKEYTEFIAQIEDSIERERMTMPEKFVITRRNMGLDDLKKVVETSRTVYISNANREIIDELDPVFREDAKVFVVMSPGEVPPRRDNMEVKVSTIPVVHLIDKVEVPATNVQVDEERSFGILKNPFTKRWEVDEMLFEDCVACFREFWRLGWDSSSEAPVHTGCAKRQGG